MNVISPANESTSVSRYVPMTISVNIDNDEAGTNGININTLFTTTDDFKAVVLDGATQVGTATFHKTGVAWSGAAPTAQRQNIALTIDGPLTVGVHTFNVAIKDPLGTNLTSGTQAVKVLVWDRPTLQVNAKPVLAGATIVTDRTNAYEFTGTKFNIGADSTSVSLVIDGGAETVTLVRRSPAPRPWRRATLSTTMLLM